MPRNLPASLRATELGDGVDAPRRHLRAKVTESLPPKEASVKQASTIGLDIAKHVFQVHGADGAGHVLFRSASLA